VIVRPTSETIIGDAFARWVRSYRDLPLLINQWCNIVRWEMRTRMFLQAGTSHFLGQNFAKASEIRFLDQSGEQQHAWTTSWGSSTRLIGAILMTHSDDDGFVAPPKVAPLHVAILPIFRSDEDKPRVLEYCHNVARELRAQRYADRQVTVLVDERDERGGDKVWHWIKKGVPLRLEIGARDMAKDALFVGRRDRAPKDKQSVPRGELVASVAATSVSKSASRTNSASPCAAFRWTKASRASVRLAASPARNGSCGRRPIDRPVSAAERR